MPLASSLITGEPSEVASTKPFARTPSDRDAGQPGEHGGIASLVGFALALTRVDSAFAGRAYAAYGGIYIAASLAWLLGRGAAGSKQGRRVGRSARDRGGVGDYRVCRPGALTEYGFAPATSRNRAGPVGSLT
jgi:hypothetical protein